MDKLAKIVATLGPSTQTKTVLKRLIEAGVDVVRLNFSHGDHAEHAERIALIRQIAQEMGRSVTILQDLQGPKIRVGTLTRGPMTLTQGQELIIDSTASDDLKQYPEQDGSAVIPVDFPELPQCLIPGRSILLDDGRLELEVLEVAGEQIAARVIQGGTLSSHKGINLPGSRVLVPGFTKKDRADLAFGLEHEVDAVAISFVRSAADITQVRDEILKMAPGRRNTALIAKLERPEALENLEEILEASDGVMVARGDLGVEMSPAQVPIAQKRIIKTASRYAKFVITATQMLESMIANPRPTRAEASDVANAIFDGTDAVMLSGETAVGKYPVETVMLMSEIIQQAEEHYVEWGECPVLPEEASEDDAVSITRAAKELAHDRDVSAIAVFTQTGRTALLMSKTRPRVPILAFTPEKDTFQRMGFFWGVKPFLVPYSSDMESMIKIVEETMMAATPIQAGEQVILLSGFPIGAMRPPNLALLHTVGGDLR